MKRELDVWRSPVPGLPPPDAGTSAIPRAIPD